MHDIVIQRWVIQIDPDTKGTVEISVNMRRIAGLVGYSAAKNRTGRSSYLRGAVTAKRIKGE